MKTTPTIHSSLDIGPHRLKNRLVALPVFTGYAFTDGRVSPMLLKHYKRLAASGVSMVIVGNVAVSSDGATSRYNLRIDTDAYIPGLIDLAAAIKRQGPLACIQLNHAGRFAKTDQPLLSSPTDTSNLAFNVSALKDFMNSFPLEKRFGLTHFFLKQVAGWHRAMTDAEIQAVIAEFRDAALRACEAGFDMVELHGANGYLLCEFLSPATNKLQTGFGGTFENRASFPLTVVREIRRSLPPEVPLGYRLLLDEWVPGGIELKEAIAFARLLEQEGIAYLSASAGTFNSFFRAEVIEKMAELAYLQAGITRLTRNVQIPTIISGRITNPTLANELLEQGAADLIGLGRPLRADSHWVHKAGDQAPDIITCMNCNWCLKRVILEQGFNCQRWPGTVKQRTDLDHSLLTRNTKNLWVITDGNDLKLFKTVLPILSPMNPAMESKPSLNVLFLHKEQQPDYSPEDKIGFLKLAKKLLSRHGLGGDTFAGSLERQAAGDWEKEVCDEVDHHNYGVVLIGRSRYEPWRQRIFYKLHHKVIGLIGPGAHPNNVVVPLDLSGASLLILNFLQQTWLKRPEIDLSFIHVLNRDESSARKRWAELKKIAGLESDVHLKLIEPVKNVAAAIFKEIQMGSYGTIIMGKRGLSGIKRFLLGSVSSGILSRLEDQSIFLVD